MATKTNTEINGKDYYRIRRTIDGKQKAFYGTSKGDAEKKYRAYVEEQSRLKHERARISDTATLGMRAEEYVKEVLIVSQKYAQGTIDEYERAYKLHVKNSPLAKMRLRDVRVLDVQRFYNQLDVTMPTLRKINKFMVAFYKWLALCDYAPNIMSAVELPKKPNPSKSDEIIIWDDDEIQMIINMDDDYRLKSLVMTLLYTGMRISEVLALKYADIKDDVIHIDRQWYRDEIKPPKYGSKRVVPVHEELKPILERHEKWHRAEMKANGYTTEYIFTTKTGKLYSASSVRTSLVRYHEKHGIPYKKIHAYRATFCTQLCKCGVSLEVASKLLGHKALDVTAAHYALVSKETQRDAIDRLKF